MKNGIFECANCRYLNKLCNDCSILIKGNYNSNNVRVCRGHKYQMAKTHKTYSLRDSCIITDKFPYLTKMRICHIKE